MQSLRRVVLALLLFSVVGAAAAAAQAGKDYSAINPPQPTDTGSKVEVIEFFSYACPHCNHLEPGLEAWSKRVPANVVLHRVPVTFGRPDWVALVKLYYTLETMGVADKMNAKVFSAIHDAHQTLNNAESCTNWAASQGLDARKFADVFNSFGVQAKVQRANAKAAAYAVDGVPMLVVDGKFRTSPAQAGGNEQSLAVTDELIALTAKDHR